MYFKWISGELTELVKWDFDTFTLGISTIHQYVRRLWWRKIIQPGERGYIEMWKSGYVFQNND